MKKTIFIILLCVGVLLMLLGGIFLFLNLSDGSFAFLHRDGSAWKGDNSSYDQPNEIVVTPESGMPGEGYVPSVEPPAESVYPDLYEVEDPSLEYAVDFTFTDRDGVEHRLSDFYGKPIIINFWATWCPPCQAELPYFDAASKFYQDKIQFLMVDLVDGSYETEDSTIQFVEENRYSFPLFFDSYGEGSDAYEITAIPLTVAINSHGQIVTTHLGSMTQEELMELINQLLK